MFVFIQYKYTNCIYESICGHIAIWYFLLCFLYFEKEALKLSHKLRALPKLRMYACGDLDFEAMKEHVGSIQILLNNCICNLLFFLIWSYLYVIYSIYISRVLLCVVTSLNLTIKLLTLKSDVCGCICALKKFKWLKNQKIFYFSSPSIMVFLENME